MSFDSGLPGERRGFLAQQFVSFVCFAERVGVIDGVNVTYASEQSNNEPQDARAMKVKVRV